MKALTLIRLGGKNPGRTIAAIKRLEGVEDVFMTFGRFDGVILVKAADRSSLKKTLKSVHSVSGVRRTETLLGV